MNRREFITLVCGVSIAGRGSLAARAQEAAMPVIGYLSQGSPETDAARLTGLRRGLNEGGYVEGKNVTIECRWAGSQFDRLPALAADLVRRDARPIPASVRLRISRSSASVKANNGMFYPPNCDQPLRTGRRRPQCGAELLPLNGSSPRTPCSSGATIGQSKLHQIPIR
jgi:hypothetical protein